MWRVISRRPKKYLFFLIVFVVLVNLPLVMGQWSQHVLKTDGEDVTARVVDRASSGDNYVLFLDFPDGIGDDDATYPAKVDAETYADAAGEDATITVRVTPDRATNYRVEGEVDPGTPGLGLAVGGNLVLALIWLLWWRYGRFPRERLLLNATGDLLRCPAEPMLESLGDGSWIVQGEVLEHDDETVLLDVGGDRVRVALDGHALPTDVGHPVRAEGVEIN